MKLLFSGRYSGYSLEHLRKDFISGIIVGIIAIPLGMAFAIASGVHPKYGIYTVIVAGILISLFGGSKVQIGGPTGAFIPVLLAVVLQYGYESLLVAGFMAGVILVLLGLFRLGQFIKYMPRPVITGFTAGIAVIIFTSQIASFLGLRGVERHDSFFDTAVDLGKHLHTANLNSIIIASICLITVVAINRWLPKIPGSLAGLFMASVIGMLFFSGHVDTIKSVYGNIPSELPSFHLPNLSIDSMLRLLKPALIIAMLGAIESLLSAVVADRMSGEKHNSNRELIGQGIANMVAPMFGGIPATGAIARTATNIRSGGRTPVSGILHGVVVLLILLLFAPYTSHIPLSAMAPILMIVAWNMSERHEFVRIFKTKSSDSIVLVATFLLTVFTTLTIAVAAGIVLSLVMYLKRIFDNSSLSAYNRTRAFDEE